MIVFIVTVAGDARYSQMNDLTSPLDPPPIPPNPRPLSDRVGIGIRLNGWLLAKYANNATFIMQHNAPK